MSNVVYDSHGAEALGDISHMGNVEGGKGGKNGKGHHEIINDHDYHFKVTIQLLEDGIQKLWKEQNRDINKNRDIETSSMTDAGFRKLYTTMMFPVSYNIVTFVCLMLIIPFFFGNHYDGKGLFYAGIGFGLLLFGSILFDAYIIYRSRRFVVEKVTNKYYKIMKNSWKGYESFSLVALFILIAMSVYMLIQGNFSFFEPEVKFLKSVVDFIDFQKYFIAIILIGVFYFFMYYIAVYKFSMKAQKEQRQAIIDARTISEINADVAGDIMNDTLDDFEVHR